MRARTQFKLLRNFCILTVISSQTDLFFDKNIAYAPKVYLKFVFVPKLLKTLYFLSFHPVSLTFILLVGVTIYSIREFDMQPGPLHFFFFFKRYTWGEQVAQKLLVTCMVWKIILKFRDEKITFLNHWGTKNIFLKFQGQKMLHFSMD